MNTKAVRIHGKMDLRLDDVQLPEVGPDDVRIRVVSDSLCMSSYKVKTAATMVCIVLMFLPIPAVVNTICVWVIALTTLYSGVEYFVKNKDAIQTM